MKHIKHSLPMLLLCAMPLTGWASTNLLVDAGFEDSSNTPWDFSSAWTKFSEAYNITYDARTGADCAQMQGNFSGSPNYSGVFQDLPTAEGELWEASIWIQTTSADPMAPGNTFHGKIEFLDSTPVVLSPDNNITPQFNSTYATNYYYYLTTGVRTAYPNSATARFVLSHRQASMGSGFICGDDAEFIRYRSDEHVEAFAYSINNTSLDSQGGGVGWTNAWLESASNSNFHATNSFKIWDSSNGFTQITGYPPAHGNMLKTRPTGSKVTATRHFAPITNDDLFVATYFNFELAGANRYAGLSLMSNSAEVVFFGEIGSADKTLGITNWGGSDMVSCYTLNDEQSNPGSDYLLFGHYNFATRVFETKAYTVGDSLPPTNPAVWDASVTMAVGRVIMIDALQISAGGNSPGETYFDEIRIAQTWADLVANVPVVTSLVVKGGASVTDEDIGSGNFGLTMHFHHNAGMESVSTVSPFFVPEFDLFNPSGTMILTNQHFTGFGYVDKGRSIIATSLSHAGAAYAEVELGTYTIEWSAIASNAEARTDSSLLGSSLEAAFEVVDDDTAAPLPGQGSPAGNLLTNGSLEHGSGSTTIDGWHRTSGDEYRETWTGYGYCLEDESFPDGSYGLKTFGSAGDLSQSNLPVTAGHAYYMSGWFYHCSTQDPIAAVSTSVRLAMRVEWFDAGNNSLGENTTTNHSGIDPADTWQYIDAWVQAPSDATKAAVHVESDCNSCAGSIFGDDFQFAPARNLGVYIGGTNYAEAVEGLGSNAIHTLTDGALTGVGSGNPLKLVVTAFDASELSRGTTDSSSQMNLDLGVWSTDNVTNYNSSFSSAAINTTTNSATSTWAWVNFDEAAIDALMGTNKVSVTLRDADNDRASDGASIADQAFGSLAVVDDDQEEPYAYGLVINSNYVAGGQITDGAFADEFNYYWNFWIRLSDAHEGVYTGPVSGSYAPPVYDFVYPNGDGIRSNEPFAVIADAVQPSNRSFEIAGPVHTAPFRWNLAGQQMIRTNEQVRSGSYALAMKYTDVTNTSGTAEQWYDFSSAVTGETFTLGAYVNVYGNYLRGNSRALLKFEWWDATNGPATLQGYEIGELIDQTTSTWVRTEVSGVKTGNTLRFVRIFCEVTYADLPVTNTATVYFDDVYVGAPQNTRARDDLILEAYGSIQLGDYLFRWSGTDSDNDRSSDNLAVSHDTNIIGGHIITMIDDDTNAPIATNIVINNSNQMTDAKIRFGQYPLSFEEWDASGINTNGSLTWVPNWSMINSAGWTVHFEVGFDDIVNGDGQSFVLNDTAPGVAESNVVLGTYQLLWSARDADDDRPNDRDERIHHAVVEGNSNTFYVVDDDTIPPLPPTNLDLNITTWTNVNLFTVLWEPGSDASGISEYRVSTNWAPPTAISDGEVASGANVTNIIGLSITNGDWEIGTNATIVPDTPDRTNGWASHGSSGARGRWTTADAQSGSRCMVHTLDDGSQPGGGGRYTLIGQDVVISNVSELVSVVNYSGYFKGDLDKTFNGDKPVAFLKMEYYDAETSLLYIVDGEFDTDHNGAPGDGINASTWTYMQLTVSNGPANTAFIRFLQGVAQHDAHIPLTGYWDNVAASIGFIDVGGAVFTNAQEGVRTNWVFSVDDDSDRSDDQLMSNPFTNFITRYDATPPATIGMTNVTTGPDKTTELLVEWEPLPDAGGAELSPWWTYVAYYTSESRPATNTDPFVSIENGGPAALGTNTTGSLIISNLVFGETYRVALAGRDRAGNESILSTSAVVTLGAFAITQGVVFVNGGASEGIEMSWVASKDDLREVNKAYDLIYADAVSYSDSLTSQWQLVATVTNNVFADTGSVSRTPPTELSDTMRFYRASQAGRWKLTNEPPVVSREVYVARNISLSNGHNFISLFMEPDTNSLAGLLGTNLPAGSFFDESTYVAWYASDGVGTVTNMLWLSSALGWRWHIGDDGSDPNHKIVPMEQGFNVFIPTNEMSQRIMFVGKIPTNGSSQTITANASTPVYNLCSYHAPRRMRIRELGLAPTNNAMTGGSTRRQSDEIRMLTRKEGPLGSPRLRVWYDTDDDQWKNWVTGSVSSDEFIEPDETIIIYTRETQTSFTWDQKLYYSPPTQSMNP